MDSQHKFYDDDDAMLIDVPISFLTPQKSEIDDLEYKVDGDEDATLREVSISFIAPQESKADVVENMDNQHKFYGDEDATLVDVPITFITPQKSKDYGLEYKVDGDEDGTLREVSISFIAPQESKTDVVENMDKQHKVDRGDAIVAVPIFFVAPQAGISLHQVNADDDATLIEVPISFITPVESNADVLENEMIPKNMHYMHTHTFEQRRQNWIIKNVSRRDGSTIDYFYYHLETNKKFRSMLEVYKFVVYGEVPETKKKSSEHEKTLQVTPRREPRMWGSKLIKHYVVGTCTESCNGIYIKNRGEVNYLSERDIPSNIEKKEKRENEDLYGHQQVNLGDDATCVNSQDAALSTPVHSFFYLWDFEVIHPRERTTEVFSISDIEESKGEEPFINLLSSLHKSSGKRPLEEDKERNKSKKKKHKKRDQEQDYILEAQWRSKVDEELRLDELRARAGGASSSLVPIEVGLISGVDVEIESQTITTTPPAVEGTSKVSLSVPATTGTTIDVSGDIEAPAPFPDSEA